MNFIEDSLALRNTQFYKEHWEALDQRANPVDPEADGHFGKHHSGFRFLKRALGLDKQKPDKGSELKVKEGDKLYLGKKK